MGLWGCGVRVGVINKKLVNRATIIGGEGPRDFVVVCLLFLFFRTVDC